MKNILKYIVFGTSSKTRLNVISTYSQSICPKYADVSSNFFFKLKPLCVLNKVEEKNDFNKIYRHFHSSDKKLEKSANIDSEKKKIQPKTIYYGELTPRIKGLKIFSCLSSLGTGGLLIWIMQSTANGNNLSIGGVLWTILLVLSFSTPVLIHTLTKKYVTEITYDSFTNTYTATTLSLFLTKKYIDFKVEDITVPNRLPFLTTMCIKGRGVFVYSESFFEVDHYIKMMGYDKPVNFSLKSNDDSEKLKNSKQH